LLGEGQEIGPSVKLQHAIRSFVRPEGLARLGDFSTPATDDVSLELPWGVAFSAPS